MIKPFERLYTVGDLVEGAASRVSTGRSPSFAFDGTEEAKVVRITHSGAIALRVDLPDVLPNLRRKLTPFGSALLTPESLDWLNSEMGQLPDWPIKVTTEAWRLDKLPPIESLDPAEKFYVKHPFSGQFVATIGWFTPDGNVCFELPAAIQESVLARVQHRLRQTLGL